MFCAFIKHIYTSIVCYYHLADDIELYNKYVINCSGGYRWYWHKLLIGLVFKHLWLICNLLWLVYSWFGLVSNCLWPVWGFFLWLVFIYLRLICDLNKVICKRSVICLKSFVTHLLLNVTFLSSSVTRLWLSETRLSFVCSFGSNHCAKHS